MIHHLFFSTPAIFNGGIVPMTSGLRPRIA